MKLSHAITEHIYKSSAAAALDMTVVMDDGREQGIVGTQEVFCLIRKKLLRRRRPTEEAIKNPYATPVICTTQSFFTLFCVCRPPYFTRREKEGVKDDCVDAVGVDGDFYSEVFAGGSLIAEVRAAGGCSSGGSRQCLISNFLLNQKTSESR
ncbi:hypothetical protein IRJ41_020278 [Triplophysa rosa]|uniref:Uncharacterized protein n=1 Tax=Triplophysa rosa TaxID=992332 RepID=A0A9W7WBL1_TRIRA|nr:hypothetical protein IRJ41_020278 [Triplophysa rosa]